MTLSIDKKIDKIINFINECEKYDEDYGDYLSDLEKEGFNRNKLHAMIARAEEIAKKKGNEGDKKVIIGILQNFIKKEKE